jgi:hypothetical protein
MKPAIRIGLVLVLLLCRVVRSGAEPDKIKSLCEVSYPSDARIDWECVKLQWTDTPSGLFGSSWEDGMKKRC